MKMFHLWTATKSIFFTLFVSSLIYQLNAVDIRIKQGILRGFKQYSRNGTEYHAFLGIPYAKPPVGNLRFEPPQPPDSWAGVRDATKPPPSCVQKEMIFRYSLTVTGQEDCLYLNVYTPANNKRKSALPVMVWIHGGGLFEGSGFFYSPIYFLDHEIIIVSINYRLGVIGFLSAADEVLPGNYGMKDQAYALKWVHQNIKDFGGDPQRVTIFGESAGGLSVHLHMFSPLSKGLFHRAISQSGTALATWAQITTSGVHQRFISFGILAGCPLQSTRVMVDCLRKISAEELLQISQKFYIWNFEPMLSFSTVIEPATVTDAFLTRNPWKENALNEVPWIVGMNSGEGIIKAAGLLSNNAKFAKEFDNNYKRLMPLFFSYLGWLEPHEMDDTSEKLRQYYFKDQKIGMETASDLVNMLTDAYFTYDLITAAHRHSNSIFVYYFDHEGEQSLEKLFGNISLDLGVTHADDLLSFFLMPVSSETMTSADLSVSKRLVTYWVNFAYTGNPTLDNSWKHSKSGEIDYLHIKTEIDIMQRGLHQDRYMFWKNSLAHPINIFETEADVVVNIKQGRLKGLTLESGNGRKYHAFLGIPYAKPPVGRLRFQPPELPDKWTGERDATTHATMCPQLCYLALGLNISDSQIMGQEDCLYMNIYTPSNITFERRLPVMVYIHPGGFVEGSGALVDPIYFLDHEIVIATFNYRLGILGFLSAADEVLPGNYGLKDQSAALRWVQQNIAQFGGDPERVTIFGHSAGAGSVHLHMHSPLSKGLFHRAISQSGSAFSIWAQTPRSVARQKFRSVGLLAGCPTESTSALVNCLKKLSVENLIRIHKYFFVWDVEPTVTFSAVVESENVVDAFLTESPWKQNVLHSVPWIVGFCSGEGGVKAARYLSDDGKRAAELNSNYKRFFPYIFFYLYWLEAEKLDQVSKALKHYYFGDKEIGFETAHSIVDIVTDGFIAVDSLEAASRHPNNVYFYYFDHKNEKSLNAVFGNCPIDLGVSHADDMINLFHMPSVFPKLSSKGDLDVSRRILKHWINFASSGNPSSDNAWSTFKVQELNYLHITSEGDRMKKGLLEDRYEFWKNLSIHPSIIDIASERLINDEL